MSVTIANVGISLRIPEKHFRKEHRESGGSMSNEIVKQVLGISIIYGSRAEVIYSIYKTCR